MSTRETPWPQGTPSWVDLSSTDREGSWAFYEALMEWQIDDSGAEFGNYGIALKNGGAVAGLGGKMEGDPSPSAWVTYLATDDAAATAEAIAANGGTVLVPPMPVGDLGVMVIGLDPTGAMFGVWQAGRHIGCSIVNEPGTLVWNEHLSNDPGAARAFYGAVFGHTYTAMGGELDYTTIDGEGPGGTVGGIGAPAPGPGAGTPAQWLAYFAVDDAEKTAATATETGGTVISGPSKTPYGLMAVLADPTGARFAVMGVNPEAAAQG